MLCTYCQTKQKNNKKKRQTTSNKKTTKDESQGVEIHFSRSRYTMFKPKKYYMFLMIITGVLMLSACGGNGADGKSSNGDNVNSNNNSKSNDVFDVHGIELKVKEEPEEIEKTEFDDESPKKTFRLTEERAEEIVTAIINQDEETLKKHNYFGDRILDKNTEQTVHMEEFEFGDGDPMKEENTTSKNELSEFTFQHANELIDFKEKFEAETDEVFEDYVDEYYGHDTNNLPTFYRTEDILEYAEYKGFTSIDLEERETNISDYTDIPYEDNDLEYYDILIQPKDEEELKDDWDDKKVSSIYLHFDRYKDGYYYLNGVQIGSVEEGI